MITYDNVLDYWKKQDIQVKNDLRAILDNFRILFAYNSNKIENESTSYHNTREIFENGRVINYTGDLRTLYEIQNQKDCYEFLVDKIIEKEPISRRLILDVHKHLCKGCYDESGYLKGERPGAFKINDYGVGDDVGVYPEEVEGNIDELCEEIDANTDADPLTVAAYFHLRFETIHPFADGNGRTGRTLMNYYLITHNYPPTIIYDEDKQTYYMALAVYDKADDIKGFVRFLKEQTIKTWTNKISRYIPSENGSNISGLDRKSIREQVESIKAESEGLSQPKYLKDITGGLDLLGE